MADLQPPPVLAADAEDPLAAYKFWIEMQSVIEGMFIDCSGLSMEREVHEYKEGGINDRVHVLPGRTKHPHIVLKHGCVLSSKLWDWYQEGLYDCVVRRVPLSIILYDGQNNKVKCWNVRNAFPVKWVGPDLKADSNQAAVETIEIAHDGISLEASTTRST